jgi:dTDP-glucose 4,6-dehydratase
MDPAKIESELLWRPSRSLEEGLKETVAWFIANRSWWQPLGERYSGERLGMERAAILTGA